MAKTTLGLEPDEKEVFEHESILEMGQKYPHLPKVVYVDMVQCQGLMHDTYVYGLSLIHIYISFCSHSISIWLMWGSRRFW